MVRRGHLTQKTGSFTLHYMDGTLPGGHIRFSLDTGSGVPVYRQLIKQIENAVLSGRMKAGDKLPTIRALSVQLKINPNTIVKVYNELEIRGLVVTQVGSGTYISDKCPAPDECEHNKKILETAARFLQEMNELGVGRDDLIKLLKENDANGFQPVMEAHDEKIGIC
jgi:GntR family transcriptional regulator